MKQSTYQQITDRFIEILEKGTVPWRQPWSNKTGNMFDQQNLATQHQYRGINAIITMCQGYESPYWLTYKQAAELGANVKKGEKGTPIVFWIKASKIDKENPEETKGSFMVPKTYVVFNVAQVENLDLSEALLKRKGRQLEFNPIAECEAVVSGFKNAPIIGHREQRAYYRESTDSINMPQKESFKSEQEYYAILFHEMIHSTGHKSRVHREFVGQARFGSHEYSKEELIAELGSAFLCSRSGIDSPDLENQSAAYLASWLKALKNDSKMLIQAASQAQKATEYILGIKKEEGAE